MARIKDLVIQVMELYDKGYTLSKIALVTELSVNEVDQILSDYHEYYVPVY
jgi:orotate phosphoribosyltransferase-like protein